MLRIIRLELKKIIYSKLTIAMILVGFILIIYSFISNYLNYKVYDKDGNAIKGYEAIITQKDNYKNIFDGMQTNEKILSNIKFLNKYYDAEKNKTVFEINENTNPPAMLGRIE